MPFTKIKTGKDKGKYRSDKGKLYTSKQVKAYYATGGWKRAVKKVKNKFRK